MPLVAVTAPAQIQWGDPARIKLSINQLHYGAASRPSVGKQDT
jgi:hypothetical protein